MLHIVKSYKKLFCWLLESRLESPSFESLNTINWLKDWKKVLESKEIEDIKNSYPKLYKSLIDTALYKGNKNWLVEKIEYEELLKNFNSEKNDIISNTKYGLQKTKEVNATNISYFTWKTIEWSELREKINSTSLTSMINRLWMKKIKQLYSSLTKSLNKNNRVDGVYDFGLFNIWELIDIVREPPYNYESNSMLGLWWDEIGALYSIIKSITLTQDKIPTLSEDEKFNIMFDLDWDGNLEGNVNEEDKALIPANEMDLYNYFKSNPDKLKTFLKWLNNIDKDGYLTEINTNYISARKRLLSALKMHMNTWKSAYQTKRLEQIAVDWIDNEEVIKRDSIQEAFDSKEWMKEMKEKNPSGYIEALENFKWMTDNYNLWKINKIVQNHLKIIVDEKWIPNISVSRNYLLNSSDTIWYWFSKLNMSSSTFKKLQYIINNHKLLTWKNVLWKIADLAFVSISKSIELTEVQIKSIADLDTEIWLDFKVWALLKLSWLSLTSWIERMDEHTAKWVLRMQEKMKKLLAPDLIKIVNWEENPYNKNVEKDEYDGYRLLQWKYATWENIIATMSSFLNIYQVDVVRNAWENWHISSANLNLSLLWWEWKKFLTWESALAKLEASISFEQNKVVWKDFHTIERGSWWTKIIRKRVLKSPARTEQVFSDNMPMSQVLTYDENIHWKLEEATYVNGGKDHEQVPVTTETRLIPAEYEYIEEEVPDNSNGIRTYTQHVESDKITVWWSFDVKMKAPSLPKW